MQNSLSFLSTIFSFLWRQRVVLRFDIRRWQTSLSIQPWCSKNINHYIPSYLPSSKLTMISLVEHVFGLPEEEEAMLEGPLLTTKAGGYWKCGFFTLENEKYIGHGWMITPVFLYTQEPNINTPQKFISFTCLSLCLVHQIQHLIFLHNLQAWENFLALKC